MDFIYSTVKSAEFIEPKEAFDTIITSILSNFIMSGKIIFFSCKFIGQIIPPAPSVTI